MGGGLGLIGVRGLQWLRTGRAGACLRTGGAAACATHRPHPCPRPPCPPPCSQQFNGYICTNSLNVKVVDGNATMLADAVSATVDAAIEAGGNLLQARASMGAGNSSRRPQSTRVCAAGACLHDAGAPQLSRLARHCRRPAPQVGNTRFELSPAQRSRVTSLARTQAVDNAGEIAETLAKVRCAAAGCAVVPLQCEPMVQAPPRPLVLTLLRLPCPAAPYRRPPR